MLDLEKLKKHPTNHFGTNPMIGFGTSNIHRDVHAGGVHRFIGFKKVDVFVPGQQNDSQHAERISFARLRYFKEKPMLHPPYSSGIPRFV